MERFTCGAATVRDKQVAERRWPLKKVVGVLSILAAADPGRRTATAFKLFPGPHLLRPSRLFGRAAINPPTPASGWPPRRAERERHQTVAPKLVAPRRRGIGRLYSRLMAPLFLSRQKRSPFREATRPPRSATERSELGSNEALVGRVQGERVYRGRRQGGWQRIAKPGG